LKLSALFLAFTALLFADGGSVLLRKQSGSFLITVFGTPQVGTTDFSVLVQNALDHSPVLDASVDIRVAHNIQPATHEQATNKLLYAASINFFRPGRYSMQVNAWRNGYGGSIDGDIIVAPASPPLVAYWPYFAVIPAAIFLFILNQRLKSRRRVRRLAAPP
jgi:hypothetical protein